MFVLGEVTKTMTPDDVVVFLNRATRYGRVPADLDGFLNSVRNGSLSLYKFDEDATLMVNTVSQWFGEGRDYLSGPEDTGQENGPEATPRRRI